MVLVNCDKTILSIPEGIRADFAAALERTCKLLNHVAGTPDYAYKALPFILKFGTGLHDCGSGVLARSRERLTCYPYLLLDYDVDKFLNVRPRAAPAGSAAEYDAVSKAAAATKLHGKGQTAKALQRLTGTPPVRCSEANNDQVRALYPPPSDDSIPFARPKSICRWPP